MKARLAVSNYKLVRAPDATDQDLAATSEVSMTNEDLTNISIVYRMPKLSSLNVAFNRLETIQGLDACTELTVLHVSHNKLASLNGVSTSMSKLRVLTAANNRISSLEPLKGLGVLQDLWIQKNALANVAELGHLRSISTLKRLVLNPNPLCKACGTPESYRCFVVAFLTQIVQLDGKVITEKERERAKMWALSPLGSKLIKRAERRPSGGSPPTRSVGGRNRPSAVKAITGGIAKLSTKGGGDRISARGSGRSHSRDRRRRKLEAQQPRKLSGRKKASATSSMLDRKKRTSPKKHTTRSKNTSTYSGATNSSSSGGSSIAAQMSNAVSSLPDFSKKMQRLPRSDPPPPQRKQQQQQKRPSRRQATAVNRRPRSSDAEEDETMKYLREAKEKVQAIQQMQGVVSLQMQLAANIKKRMAEINEKLDDAKELEKPVAHGRKSSSPMSKNAKSKSKKTKSNVAPPLKPFKEVLKERMKKREREMTLDRLRGGEGGGGNSGDSDASGIKSRISAALADFNNDTTEVFARLKNKLGWKVEGDKKARR